MFYAYWKISLIVRPITMQWGWRLNIKLPEKKTTPIHQSKLIPVRIILRTFYILLCWIVCHFFTWPRIVFQISSADSNSKLPSHCWRVVDLLFVVFIGCVLPMQLPFFSNRKYIKFTSRFFHRYTFFCGSFCLLHVADSPPFVVNHKSMEVVFLAFSLFPLAILVGPEMCLLLNIQMQGAKHFIHHLVEITVGSQSSHIALWWAIYWMIMPQNVWHVCVIKLIELMATIKFQHYLNIRNTLWLFIHCVRTWRHCWHAFKRFAVGISSVLFALFFSLVFILFHSLCVVLFLQS